MTVATNNEGPGSSLTSPDPADTSPYAVLDALSQIPRSRALEALEEPVLITNSQPNLGLVGGGKDVHEDSVSGSWQLRHGDNVCASGHEFTYFVTKPTSTISIARFYCLRQYRRASQVLVT